jgi:hypothetical protein
MPGFDGTGPAGMGPLTGGARGWCNPYTTAYRGRVPFRYPAYGAYPRALGRPRWGIRLGAFGRGLRGRGWWGRGRGRW